MGAVFFFNHLLKVPTGDCHGPFSDCLHGPTVRCNVQNAGRVQNDGWGR